MVKEMKSDCVLLLNALYGNSDSERGKKYISLPENHDRGVLEPAIGKGSNRPCSENTGSKYSFSALSWEC
jgi:hypothetical protein